MKVLIDMFNLLHICFSIANSTAMKEKGSFTEDDVGLYYHKVLDSLVFNAKTYGEVIYVSEGKGSLDWRRSIFPDYKGNRKHDDTYQIFKNHIDDVKELINYFPGKTIEVPGAEADDVIYSLAKHFSEQGEEVLVVSSDKDMVQLLNISEKIKVFSPVSKEFREPNKNIILEKAIVGDRSDNIPGIPRIGIKTFEKALTDKNIWESKIEPNIELINKYIQIIDLSKAPSFIKDESILQEENSEYKQFDPASVEKFMFDNSLKEHLSKWNSDISDINMALYYSDNNKDSDAKKDIELTKIEDVDDMLNFINNLTI